MLHHRWNLFDSKHEMFHAEIKIPTAPIKKLAKYLNQFFLKLKPYS